MCRGALSERRVPCLGMSSPPCRAAARRGNRRGSHTGVCVGVVASLLLGSMEFAVESIALVAGAAGSSQVLVSFPDERE